MVRIGVPHLRRSLVALAFLLGWNAAPASAAPILYTVTQVNGAHWRYEYYADAPGNVWLMSSGFTVYFDYATVGEILSATAPSNWDVFTAQPSAPTPNDPNLFPAPGIFDALALADYPNPSPFIVDFTWLSAAAPGSQVYSIYTNDPFTPVETGMTMLRRPTAVPEPATLVLALSGCAAAAVATRFRRRRDD